jgi:(1->4)-alpha-D-glucan 1-alpha-D-glucosylmutase
LLADLLGRMEDGRVKLYLIYKALGFRRAEPGIVQSGDYLPLGATGEGKEHLCAFARTKGGQWALAAAPRLSTRLCGPEGLPLGEKTWDGAALLLPREAPVHWRNVFTGETLAAEENKQLALAEVFGAFPVALLVPAR